MSSPLRLNFEALACSLSLQRGLEFRDFDEPVILGRFGEMPREFE
jgi:hypothetical protein